MERKYVIGLDYGTLSGRAIIADCKDGTVLASAVKEYDHGVMSEYLPDGTELTMSTCLSWFQSNLITNF